MASVEVIQQLEAAGRFEEAASSALDLVEQSAHPAQRIPLYERAAYHFEQHLGQPEAALMVLLQAFSEAPTQSQLLDPLERLAHVTGRWSDLLDVAEAGLASLGDDNATFGLRIRLAQWYEHCDRQEDFGRHLCWLYKAAPAEDDYRQTYTQWLVAQQDFDGLLNMGKELIRNTTDPAARVARVQEIVQVFLQPLNRPADALELLAQLYVEAPEPQLEAPMFEIAQHANLLSALVPIYRRALAKPGLTNEQKIERRLALGRLYAQTFQDLDRAATQFARALLVNPEHPQALAALRAVLVQQERFEELSQILEQEGKLLSDPQARFDHYVLLGDLYRDPLKNDAAAVEAWFSALDARPNDRGVLARLLGVYGDSQRWEASIKVLRRLASMEQDPVKQAQYFYTIGIIQRDKVEDHYVAVRTLDRALEIDPTLTKAFQAIDEILTHDGDYARQDRYYRKMLVRAREHDLDDGLVVSLARNLGEINRSRLGNYPEAIKAYQIVAHKRPDNPVTQSILSELFALTGDLVQAAEHARTAYELKPGDANALHEYARRAIEAQQIDAAWCACQALVVLGWATEDERHFYEEGRRHQSARAQRALEASDWPLLSVVGRPIALDQIMTLAWQNFGRQMLSSPKSYGLNPKQDLLDLSEGGPNAQLLNYAQQIVGLQAPALWQAEAGQTLSIVAVDPPGLFIPDNLHQLSFADAMAQLARQLYLSSAQHLIAQIDPSPQLTQARSVEILQAAQQCVTPDAPGEADAGLVEAFSKLSPAEHQQLVQALAKLKPPFERWVERWLIAMEQTANRLALLLSNDLHTVIQHIQREPQPRALPQPSDRMQALLLYSISRPYQELRQRLGYALRVGG